MLEILEVGGAPNEPWILGRSTLGRQGGQTMTTDYVAILRREAGGRLKYYLDMFTGAARPPIELSGQQPTFTPDSSPPARVTLSGRVEVPMQLVRGLPIVEVRVNGSGPFLFGIETGANFVAVTPDLVAKLSLVRAGGPEIGRAHV